MRDKLSHYGIDLNNHIPGFSQWEKWDNDICMAHTHETAEKLSNACMSNYEKRDKDTVPVAYFDFERSKRIYGNEVLFSEDPVSKTHFYSRIDSSFYKPTQFSIQPLKEKTIASQVEKIIAGLSLVKLNALPAPVYKGKRLTNKDEMERIINQNQNISKNNNSLIQGKLNDIIKSLQDKSHEKEMSETGIQETPQKQPQQKIADKKAKSHQEESSETETKISSSKEEPATKLTDNDFEQRYNDLIMQNMAVNSRNGAEIKKAVRIEMKSLASAGISLEKRYEQMQEILNRQIKLYQQRQKPAIDGSM